MGNIEKADGRSRSHVFLYDPRGILDRHLPPAKVDHLSTELFVHGIQGCGFEVL
jgi:hypothetical protein